MRARARRFEGLVVLVIFVVLSMSTVSSVGVVDVPSVDFVDGGTTTPDGAAAAESVHLVSVGDEHDQLWPFTSRARSFDTLTLPINLVVEGDPARVRSLLVYSTDARWDETDEVWKEASSEGDAADPTGRTWGSATGADRYTYVETESGGFWADESMQLHEGTYFGSRIHLRLYGAGGHGHSWTAIQAHRDYWDWFRLRHTVTGLDGPRHTVERDLADQPAVVDVRRERYGNGGIIDADGWVSVVELAPPQLVSDSSLDAGTVDTDGAHGAGTDTGDAGASGESSVTDIVRVGAPLSILIFAAAVGGAVATATDRDDIDAVADRFRQSHLTDTQFQRASVLFVTLVVLPLVVRGTALALEGFAPNQPKLIAGLLYPIFALAPPIVALRLPRGLSPEVWFGIAFVAYGIGLVTDFGLVGVTAVPVSLVVHRFVVLVSLGLFAVLGHRRSISDDIPAAALPSVASLWVFVLLWPLLLGV